jgi:hypothetical protein
MRPLKCIAFLLVCAAVTIGASRTPPIQQVEVQNHFTSTVCAGLCVDQTVAVSADGHVWWRTWDPYFHGTSRPTLRRFLVKPDAAAAFIRAMNEVRPAESSSDRNGCDAEVHVRHVWDWEVSWKGPGHPIRLRTCDGDKRVVSAWRAGIKALGMPWGLAGELDKGVVELPAE